MTIDNWLRSADKKLSSFEWRLLIEKVTSLSPTQQRSRDYLLNDAELAALNAYAERIQDQEPLAYLLGSWSFMDLDLLVTPATLIPRPDTEVLVEQALFLCKDAKKIIDLGTGSGAIAIFLARALPKVHIFAVDQSKDALTIAQENAGRYQIKNITFIKSNWLAAFDERVDGIVSNPPYIAPNDDHLVALKHEPLSALVAADNGFADLFTIIDSAPRVLNSNAYLLLEHGFEQGKKVRDHFDTSSWTNIKTALDRAQRERVTSACCIN